MSTAFKTADILLPKDTSMESWAVVACDQYTSEPEYWKKAEALVGDAPSTLQMILPEVYLNETPRRVPVINENMVRILDFVFQPNGVPFKSWIVSSSIC